MATSIPPKSKALEDCRYMARSLAISMQDLAPEQKEEILRYLNGELDRLAAAPGEQPADDDNDKDDGWEQSQRSCRADEGSGGDLAC